MATTEIAAVQGGAGIVLDVRELNELPAARADQIRAVFEPMANMVEGFEDEYNAVMAAAAEEVTPAVSRRARNLRLGIAKVRIMAENARVEIKREYLLAGRAIDGANNVLKWAISQKEEALEAIEKHAERMEEERRAALHSERMEALAPYVEDIPDRDFSAMDDEVWEAYLATKKRDHEDRIEAEKKAAAERAERERIQALNVERSKLVAPVFNFFRQAEGEENLGALSEADFQARLHEANEARDAHEAEQERIRQENARLAAEAAEAEARRKAEREAAELVARKQREAAEAAIQAEREAAEVERRRREELERAEAERIAAEKREAEARAAAEAEAAKAPTKRRLAAWVDSFEIPDLPGDDHPVAAEIRHKFDGFQAWARKQVESV